MKKILCLILVCCLVFATFPEIEKYVQAADEEYVVTINDATAGTLKTKIEAVCLSDAIYTTKITKLVVIGKMNDSDFTSIQSILSNKITTIDLSGVTDLTKIPDNAFLSSQYINLKEVNLPEGVTSIGNSAFSSCISLESIELPEGVTSIGNRAFFSCESLESIELPEGVTSIENEAFSHCTNLSLIFLPERVTSIGASAFARCSSLSLTSLPDSVTSIGSNAFGGCSSLSLTSLPSNLTSIESDVFYECSSLSLTSLPSGITSIGDSSFEGCINLSLTSLPEGVTSIGMYAFWDCSSMSLASLPERVTSIGMYAFYNCSSMSLTSLPSGITSICESAFEECSSMSLTSLPTGVTSIGNFAFWGCSSISLTSLPSGVTSIGSNAFYDCTSMPSVLKCDFATGITCNDGAFLGSSVGYLLFEDEDCSSESFSFGGLTGVNSTGDFDNDGMDNITEYNQGRLLYKPDIFVTLSYDDAQKKAVFEYNEEYIATLPDENTDYTVKYNGRNSTTYAESTTPPTEDGEYTATYALTTTGGAKFTIISGSTLTVDFDTRKSSELSVSCANVVYGNAPAPSVSNSTGGTRTTEYKVRGADDSTYSTTVPTNAGDYTIRVKEAGTLTHMEGLATADFSITKKAITMTVSIANKQYDGLNKAEIVSASLNNSEIVTKGGVKDNVSLLTPYPTATFSSISVGNDISVSIGTFSLTGTDAANYILTQPTNIKANIVSTYIAAKNIDYTVSSNDWIKTDFTVTAKTGFELSLTNTAGGTWSNTLSKSNETSNENIEFYVRNISTGVISKMATESYKIDKTAPVIVGVTNGETYYTDKVVTVTDENIDTITVNDVAFRSGDTLLANKEATYVIVAKDKAGNTTTVTVTMNLLPENGKGNVIKDIVKDEKAPEILFNNEIEALEDFIFTEEEKGLIEAGLDAKIYLEVKDITETVDNNDKKLIDSSITDYKLGEYIDISLFKKLGDSLAQKISTSDVPISITLIIPENLRANEDYVTRTYSIVRVHNGETTIIDGEYDEKTGEFVFETDKFSTYAIIYRDVIEEAKAEPPSTRDIIEESKTELPSTRDITNVWLWSGLIVMSAVAFSVNIVFRRNRKFR